MGELNVLCSWNGIRVFWGFIVERIYLVISAVSPLLPCPLNLLLPCSVRRQPTAALLSQLRLYYCPVQSIYCTSALLKSTYIHTTVLLSQHTDALLCSSQSIRGVPSANFLPSSECRVLRLCSAESEFRTKYLHVLNDQR